MRTVYIDSDFKCHVINDGTMTAVETEFFDGKCDAFVEGYRFIPEGHKWKREDGVVFRGALIAPWKSYPELDTAQRIHEKQLLAKYETLISKEN